MDIASLVLDITAGEDLTFFNGTGQRTRSMSASVSPSLIYLTAPVEDDDAPGCVTIPTLDAGTTEEYTRVRRASCISGDLDESRQLVPCTGTYRRVDTSSTAGFGGPVTRTDDLRIRIRGLASVVIVDYAKDKDPDTGDLIPPEQQTREVIGIGLSFVGCSRRIITRNDNIITDIEGIDTTPMAWVYFDDGPGSQDPAYVDSPRYLPSYFVSSGAPIQCGGFSFSSDQISGRPYSVELDGQPYNDRRCIASFSDATECVAQTPFLGGETAVVMPQVPYSTGGGQIDVTPSGSASIEFTGTITDADAPICGDPGVSIDCTRNTGGDPGGSDAGSPGGIDDPAILAEIARQQQARTGQYPGRCPSCGG